MKTIFDKTTRDELISRINMLTENSTAQWGKMNIHQMLKHCIIYDETALGKRTYKRQLLGRLFGKMALKDMIGDEKPIKRNMPTLPELKIEESTGDFTTERAQWIALIEAYAHFSNPGFVHGFTGKMTKEQIGQLNYKHIDHHLRQFNC